MKSSRRKTRSDKFPLTLHATGQYCKKIQGKMYYFGADRKQALERYLDQATYLHGGRNLIQKASSGNMTLEELCTLYLHYQQSKVKANGLSAKHHNDQISSLKKFMAFLGHDRKIKNISTLALQRYKRKLRGDYGSVCRLNLHISILKAMFHWARKNDILENIPNIDAISRNKVVYQEKFTFNSEYIKRLLAAADIKMRAMIWLGLNCGFGCTDCAQLKWKDLDFVNNRVRLARNKTGIPRNLPLWPETIQALRKVQKSGELVFYTSRGHPWIRTLIKADDNGQIKYAVINSITPRFSELLRRANIHAPKGTGFYTLRRTAATIAARSGDPFAVQTLLGHADQKMATRYVQDVSEQTDRVIANSRKYVI
jgi:integrase